MQKRCKREKYLKVSSIQVNIKYFLFCQFPFYCWCFVWKLFDLAWTPHIDRKYTHCLCMLFMNLDKNVPFPAYKWIKLQSAVWNDCTFKYITSPQTTQSMYMLLMNLSLKEYLYCLRNRGDGRTIVYMLRLRHTPKRGKTYILCTLYFCLVWLMSWRKWAKFSHKIAISSCYMFCGMLYLHTFLFDDINYQKSLQKPRRLLNSWDVYLTFSICCWLRREKFDMFVK